MKFKNIIIFLLLAFTILCYFLISNKIGTDNNFLYKVNKILSQDTKKKLKETIFVFKNQEILKKKIKEKNKLLGEKNRRIANLTNQLQPNKISFLDTHDKKEKSIGKTKLLLTEYRNDLLENMGAKSYLEYYKKNLFLITGSGMLMFTSLNNIKNNKFDFTFIGTNLKSVIGEDYISSELNIIKHFLILDDKIYISYLNKINDNCYYNSILVANFDLKEMNFQNFFSMNECQNIPSLSAGGRLSKFKDKHILYTIGDYDSSEQYMDMPQKLDSLLGKVIKINTLNKEYKIISIGHRNPQGLFYDDVNDVVYLTEHGPQGGDEININVSPDQKLKNYGWAISSYGEHYGFPDQENKEKYKRAPLNKNHEKFGFIEPIKYFTPSIGITQIIKTELLFNNIKNKSILVFSLGYKSEIIEGDQSIHHFLLDDKYSIIKHNIIPITSRIRDIIYINEIHKLILVLESRYSIGILEALD